MNKLKLNVEDLSVDSFVMAESEESRGTVHGHAETDNCSQYCGLTSLKYYLGTTWMQQK